MKIPLHCRPCFSDFRIFRHFSHTTFRERPPTEREFELMRANMVFIVVKRCVYDTNPPKSSHLWYFRKSEGGGALCARSTPDGINILAGPSPGWLIDVIIELSAIELAIGPIVTVICGYFIGIDTLLRISNIINKCHNRISCPQISHCTDFYLYPRLFETMSLLYE